MHVTLIGLGGIGSHLAPLVARFLAHETGKHTLALIDGDAYEAKNATRQAFTEYGNKARVTATALQRQFPGLDLQAAEEYVDPDNIAFHLHERGIVLLAVDNHRTRKTVSDAAGKMGDLALVSGGNELVDGDVLLYLRRGGRDLTPPLTRRPEIADPKDKAPHEVGCEELARSGTPQILFMNAMVASLMANALWRLMVYPDTLPHDRRSGLVDTGYAEVHASLMGNAARAIPLDALPKKG